MAFRERKWKMMIFLLQIGLYGRSQLEPVTIGGEMG